MSRALVSVQPPASHRSFPALRSKPSLTLSFETAIFDPSHFSQNVPFGGVAEQFAGYADCAGASVAGPAIAVTSDGEEIALSGHT